MGKLMMLLRFIQNNQRNPTGLDIREELKMLNIDIEKLATYQLGMEKGMEIGMQKAIEICMQKGMEQGSHDSALEIAKNLLERGMESDWIASVTGLPLSDIEKLKGV